jgi:uncharacterized lipoprotein YehR (DUF1307 family)
MITNGSGGVILGTAYSMMSRPTIFIRTLGNSFSKALAQASRSYRGVQGSDLYVDINAMYAQNYTTKGKAVASTYNKYAKPFIGIAQASDAFVRTFIRDTESRGLYYDKMLEKYKGDSRKASAELAKTYYDKTRVNKQIDYYRNQFKGDINITEADIYAAAFDDLSVDATFTGDESQYIQEWTDILSLRSVPSNPILRGIQSFIDQGVNNGPIRKNIKTIVAPFSRAVLNISELAWETIPGTIAVDKFIIDKTFQTYNKMPPSRSPASLKKRRLAQYFGTGTSVVLMSLALSDVIEVTGDEEKVLDRTSNKRVSGEEARTAEDRAEFKQAGRPPFSFKILGQWFSYKDHPILAPLFYGIYRSKDKLKNAQTALDCSISCIRVLLWIIIFCNAVYGFSCRT